MTSVFLLHGKAILFSQFSAYPACLCGENGKCLNYLPQISRTWKVKTRLAKALGDEKACAVYKSLAGNVIKNIFTKNPGTYDVHIFSHLLTGNGN